MGQNLKVDLKIAIVLSGHSQRQIAAVSGIPEARLSTLVHGWAEPRDHERNAIAAALGKLPEELFGQVVTTT